MKNIDEPKILFERFIREQRPEFQAGKPFKCLNPNHRDEHPSMIYNGPDTKYPNTAHCYVCGFHGDIFNLFGELHLYGALEGPNNLPSQILAVCQWSGEDPKRYLSHEELKPKEMTPEQQDAFLERLPPSNTVDLYYEKTLAQENADNCEVWLGDHGLEADNAKRLRSKFHLGLTNAKLDYAELVIPVSPFEDQAKNLSYFTVSHYSDSVLHGTLRGVSTFNLKAVANTEHDCIYICDRVENVLAFEGRGLPACALFNPSGIYPLVCYLKELRKAKIDKIPILYFRDKSIEAELEKRLCAAKFIVLDGTAEERAKRYREANAWYNLWAQTFR